MSEHWLDLSGPCPSQKTTRSPINSTDWQLTFNLNSIMQSVRQLQGVKHTLWLHLKAAGCNTNSDDSVNAASDKALQGDANQARALTQATIKSLFMRERDSFMPLLQTDNLSTKQAFSTNKWSLFSEKHQQVNLSRQGKTRVNCIILQTLSSIISGRAGLKGSVHVEFYFLINHMVKI